MMALYTNKMDVFDYATSLACNNYVAKMASYYPLFAVVLTMKGEIR